MFRLARPGSSCLLAVSVYVIFSDHTFVALLASEASFNPVAKKILPAFPHVVCWILQCLKDTSTKSDTYTLQPITHVHAVKEEEVPGMCRLACERPAAAAAVSEKEVSAV